jgi:hypothetical protein
VYVRSGLPMSIAHSSPGWAERSRWARSLGRAALRRLLENSAPDRRRYWDAGDASEGRAREQAEAVAAAAAARCVFASRRNGSWSRLAGAGVIRPP